MTDPRDTDNGKTRRDLAQGKDLEDLERDPVEDELGENDTVPDPEDELLERDDTQYTEVEED